jgi:hypothetical protein
MHSLSWIQVRIGNADLDQNLQINLVSCLSKRLVYLPNYVFDLLSTLATLKSD